MIFYLWRVNYLFIFVLIIFFREVTSKIISKFFFLIVSFEVEEYVYNLLNMMICRGELYQREKKFKLAYWYFKEAYKFSKNLQWSFVKKKCFCLLQI